MDPKVFDVEGADIAWCPGCGDFSILRTIKGSTCRNGNKS